MVIGLRAGHQALSQYLIRQLTLAGSDDQTSGSRAQPSQAAWQDFSLCCSISFISRYQRGPAFISKRTARC